MVSDFEQGDSMKVIVSNPFLCNGAVKENLAALRELCRPYSEEDDPNFNPFSNTPMVTAYRPPESLVLQSGKFDIEEALCVDFVRNWIKNGGRLVLILGMWKTGSQGFTKSDAGTILKNLNQSLDGTILFGQDPIQFYCVPQMHAKLTARCNYDSVSKKYLATKAIIGSTNLTTGALAGRNYELDLSFDRNCSEDVAPLDSISATINDQLKDFANGLGVDQSITRQVQRVFEAWRFHQQVRIAGYTNSNLPRDA